MRHFRISRSSAALLAVAMLVPALSCPALAQVGFVPQPTPTADQLAVQMKTLAADPRNLSALIAAGEASAQLEDGAAAMQFFARAEQIAPRDPRIAAGRGAALVRMGRPGEALRRFAEAEAGGVPVLRFAADRGLAYDLTGQQRHAQAEYARALKAADDDETRRRYAVSLAISGDDDEAEEMLNPLLHRSDRAAWRTRAFVHALSGDAAAAEKVATTMMPGFGTAYVPLFRRMSQIRDPADRAFAAHLGEFTRTPARLADASIAPAPPTLPGRGRVQPTALAAYQPPAATSVAQPREAAGLPRTGQSVRDRREGSIVETTSRQPAIRSPSRADRSTPTSAPVRVAAIPPSARSEGTAPTGRPAAIPVTIAAAPPQASAAMPTQPAPLALAASQPVQRVIPASVPNSGEGQLAALAASSQPSISTAIGGYGPPAPTAAAPMKKIDASDSVLASIVRNIAVPASELGVAAPGTVATTAAAPGTITAPAAVPAERGAASVKIADVAREALAKEATARKEAAAKVATARKAAAAKKEADAKEAEAKKPPPDPARHWVQVAGGANVRDLPREWQKLVDKAPDALKGRSAWTTPLRMTNRLLTGPFKTTGEAQGFVNTLGKAGLSGFAFTSEAGQKIDKLPIK